MKNLDIYETMVKLNPEIQRKGKSMPYTSMNGNMFSFLDKEGCIGLRVSEEDKKAFNEAYEGSDNIQHNSVMRGYIKMEDRHLKNTVLIEEWWKKSLKFAKELPVKATKKKK